MTKTETCAHDWDGGYPWRTCESCGLVEEAPEPDYGEPDE